MFSKQYFAITLATLFELVLTHYRQYKRAGVMTNDGLLLK